MTEPTTTVPDGFKADAKGRLVPIGTIDKVDLLRDEMVNELAEEALQISGLLGAFKLKAFSTIAAFIQIRGEQYGQVTRGTKGNVTFFSYDGRFKIVRQYQDSIRFDERLQIAKELLDQWAADVTDGSRDEVKVLINAYFQTDKEGKINAGLVLSLRRFKFTDSLWLRAMEAIADSVMVVGSRSYVRIYERVGDGDVYRPVSLDMATL